MHKTQTHSVCKTSSEETQTMIEFQLDAAARQFCIPRLVQRNLLQTLFPRKPMFYHFLTQIEYFCCCKTCK